MNVFPNRTTLPDGREFTATRLVSDGRRFVVWALPAGDVVPTIVAEGPASSLVGAGPVWHVKMPSGTIRVERDTTDCGCSHPLKHWTPTVEGSPNARRIYVDPEVSDAV